MISITRQSKATTALIKAGEPVERVFHSPASKRDSRATLVRPAKVSAISSSPARSVLTQNQNPNRDQQQQNNPKPGQPGQQQGGGQQKPGQQSGQGGQQGQQGQQGGQNQGGQGGQKDQNR